MVKMILSNIEPIHIDGLNCFEEAVLSVIGILYSDYYILFWDRWGFSYNVRKNKKYMGELINRGINGLLPNLEMLYGIKVKKIKIDGKLSCLGFIINSKECKKGYDFVFFDLFDRDKISELKFKEEFQKELMVNIKGIIVINLGRATHIQEKRICKILNNIYKFKKVCYNYKNTYVIALNFVKIK